MHSFSTSPGPEAMELLGGLGSHPDQHPPPETVVSHLSSVLLCLHLQRKLCAVWTGSKGQMPLELPGHGELSLIWFKERPHLKLISHRKQWGALSRKGDPRKPSGTILKANIHFVLNYCRIQDTQAYLLTSRAVTLYCKLEPQKFAYFIPFDN